jgi:hypothetical protein
VQFTALSTFIPELLLSFPFADFLAEIVCVYTYIRIYRMSQEERTIFWEVIVLVILSKKPYMNMCPIPNGFRDRAILVVWLGCPVLSFPPALLREVRSIFWEVIVWSF